MGHRRSSVECRVDEESLVVRANVDSLSARNALVSERQIVGVTFARVQKLSVQLHVTQIETIALIGNIVDCDEAIVLLLTQSGSVAGGQ